MLATASLGRAADQTVEAASTATATVSGEVSSRATRSLLEGALVEIPELGRSVLTDSLGRYSLTDIPPGDYTLVVNYIGLDEQRRPVLVAPGQSEVVASFELDSAIEKMEAFVVSTEREGNAASITAQRNAENVKHVVSLDAFGVLPNDNAGELLIRLPGVAPRLDEEGSVTGVVVRGFNPSSNSVNVDGTQMSSSGGLGRDFRMNSISGGLFEEIEVTKAPTPDMTADSLGGTVNFKSRSPLSLKGRRRIDYRFSGKWAAPFFTHTPLQQEHRLHGLTNVGYQEVFDVLGGKRNLGIALKAFYSENANSSRSTQNYYSYATSSASDPDKALRDRDQYWHNTYPYEVRFRDIYNNRRQLSFNLRTEYKFSDNSRIWLSGIFNNADENGQRIYQERYYFSRSTESYATPPPYGVITNYGARLDGSAFSPDYVSLKSGGRHQINSTINSFLQHDRRIELAGEHIAGAFKFSGGINYSKTSVDMNDTPETATGVAYTELRTAGTTNATTGTAYTYDGTASKEVPVITQTKGASVTDIANYGGSSGTTASNLGTRLNYQSREDQRDTAIGNGVFNVAYNLDTFPDVPVLLKAGGGVRRTQVNADFNRHQWAYRSTDVTKFRDPNVVTFYGQKAVQSPFLSTEAVTTDLLAHPGDWIEDLDYHYSENYGKTKDVTERVTSAYVQGTLQWKKWQVLTGVRMERTDTDAFGYLMNPDLSADSSFSTNVPLLEAKYVNPERVTRGYTNYFPGVHVRYSATRRLIFRTSFSTSISRPLLSDVAPGLTMGSDSEGEFTNYVQINNPDLKAQYARNYDATAEYYFEPVGMVSVGLFHKDLSSFIVADNSGDAGDLLGPSYEGVQLRTKYNAGKARVRGLEFSYQQQFTFLPGIFSGLSAYANYTHLSTEGDYDNGESGEVADFIPETANAGVKWRFNGFTTEVMANYTGDYLDTYSSDRSRRIYRDERLTVNLNFSYAVWRRTNVFVNFQNLFNEPQRWFQKGEAGPRFNRAVYNGTYITFGVSGRF